MKESYEIGTVEQLRAISDMLRLRIMALLEKQAMTATQLGEELGLATAKVHYHVRELEKVGLLQLVETREKGGILEKYYRAIAHDITVSKALLSSQSDEIQTAFRELFDQIAHDFLQALRQRKEPENLQLPAGLGIYLEHLYLTREELHTLLEQLSELTRPFENRRNIEGEQEIHLSLLTYPATRQQEEKPPARISQSWIVGATSYSRKDLLKVRDDGRRLQISVVGICQFTNDVTATLIDETIASFSLVGKLLASPEVKEALKHKEKHE